MIEVLTRIGEVIESEVTQGDSASLAWILTPYIESGRVKHNSLEDNLIDDRGQAEKDEDAEPEPEDPTR